MSVEVSRVRVPGRRPSGRHAAVVFVAALALVVSVGILGQTHDPQPAPAASPAAVVPAIRGSPSPVATRVPVGTSAPTAPTPTPTPSPSPTPSPAREGVPTVTTAEAPTLAEPPWLVPSGIESLSADPDGYWRAIVDGRGMVWALGSRLARYDPGTGSIATWSVDDDARFAAGDIVPSRAGGVWLVAERTLRRFDGSTFGTAYDVGRRVTAATEGPDGSIWAASDGAVVRLAGGEETRIDALVRSDTASINAIAVDMRGAVWCAWVESGESSTGWLSRYDGSAWRVYDRDDAAPLSTFATGLTAPRGGEAWVATGIGLARFDGSGWSVPTVGGSVPTPQALAAGPDGTVWVATRDLVGRFDGSTWRTFASLGNLSGPDATASSVVPTRHGVFVSVNGVLYARTAGRWQQVLPTPATHPIGPESGSGLLAVSRSEAWIGGDASGVVWHAKDGAWLPPLVPAPGLYVRQLLRTPDGSLWAAPDGTSPRVLQGTGWTSVGAATAGGLALDSRGDVWMAASEGGRDWALHAYGLEHGTWVERGRTASTNLVDWPVHVAVGRDGAVWVGTIGAWGINPGLVRYAHGAWALVDPRGGDGSVPVMDLAVAPNGDVWVAVTDMGWDARRESWVARFDGTAWAVFEPHRGLGLDTSYYDALDVGPDGTVWVASSAGLFRYDGRTWTLLYPGMWFSDVSVAGDGTVWVVGPSGVARLTRTTSR